MVNALLVVTGSVCMLLALLEAWLMVAVFSNPGGGLARYFPGGHDLLKSHIDYLMMALLLFVFYLLFAHFQIQAGGFLVFCLCVGSLGNPALFLVRAIHPELKEHQTPLFRAAMFVSCLLTTVGYLGGAGWVAKAAWAALP